MLLRTAFSRIVSATLAMVVVECASGQVGIWPRADVLPVPGFPPNPMRLRLSAADFQSDAAWLGLRGPVASVTLRIDMNDVGAPEFMEGETVTFDFDEAGNVTRVEREDGGLRRNNMEADVAEVQNTYEQGAAATRTAVSFGPHRGQPGLQAEFRRDANGRVTRIDCKNSNLVSIAVDYAPDGSVQRVVHAEDAGDSDVWTYDSSGSLQSCSRLELAAQGAAEEPNPTPSMMCVWKGQRNATLVGVTQRRASPIEIELDEHGSMVRWLGMLGGPDPVLAERAITRDDRGNWLTITEAVSVPSKPEQPKIVWRRVIQEIKYRDAAPPAEPKPQP